MTHYMKLMPGPFKMIASGEKDIELRLNDEKRQKINVGDTIVFTEVGSGNELQAEVKALHKFASFKELYSALPLLRCGYKEEELSYAKSEDMYDYYSPEEENKYGVLGIEIEITEK